MELSHRSSGRDVVEADEIDLFAAVMLCHFEEIAHGRINRQGITPPIGDDFFSNRDHFLPTAIRRVSSGGQ